HAKAPGSRGSTLGACEGEAITSRGPLAPPSVTSGTSVSAPSAPQGAGRRPGRAPRPPHPCSARRRWSCRTPPRTPAPAPGAASNARPGCPSPPPPRAGLPLLHGQQAVDVPDTDEHVGVDGPARPPGQLPLHPLHRGRSLVTQNQPPADVHIAQPAGLLLGAGGVPWCSLTPPPVSPAGGVGMGSGH